MRFELHKRIEKFGLLSREVKDFIFFLEPIDLHLQAVHNGDQFFELDVDELFCFEAGLKPGLFGEIDEFLTQYAQKILSPAVKRARGAQGQDVRSRDVVHLKRSSHLPDALAAVEDAKLVMLLACLFERRFVNFGPVWVAEIRQS